MSVDDLRVFYGTNSDFELSQTLKVSKATISNWRSAGIPFEKQAVFQIRTHGALKADLEPVAELEEA